MTDQRRLKEFFERWQRGDRTVAEDVAQVVTADARDGRRDHVAWGELCEAIGLVGLAFHEFQQALAERPADPVVLKKLAAYYTERGDGRRAAELWQRLLRVVPGDADGVDESARAMIAEGDAGALHEMLETAVAHGYPKAQADTWLAQLESTGDADAEPTEIPRRDDPFPEPSDADCVRMAALFAGREDVYARQWCRSSDRRVGYTPVREPLTPAVIRQHLLGSFTVGVYPIRLDQTALWFSIDLDIRRNALDEARSNHEYATELRRQMRDVGAGILEELRSLGIEPLFENSGYKGRHFWVFLQAPQEARVLYHLGRLLLPRLERRVPGSLSLEFFPKQAKRTGKGLGNLIKLPLGIHQRTGYRSVLLDDEGRPITDPYGALRDVKRLSQDEFHSLVDRLKGSGVAVGKEKEPVEREGSAEVEEPAENALPLWPPDAPPPWTEADFETDRQVRHLLARCPVLAALRERVDRHRQLTHDEQIVLIHTLGHLKGGPQAVNYLLHRCVEFSPDQLMKSRLAGNPVSCPKIRKRIGHVTRTVPCNCDFSFAANHYPTPVLHLETLPPAMEDAARPKPSGSDDESTEQLIRSYTVLARRRDELEREWKELHDAVCRRLAALPDRSFVTEAGRFFLTTCDGVETLQWEQSDGA